MILKIKMIVILLFLPLPVIFAQRADDIIGKYQLPNGLHVEIFKANGKYNGRIIALNGYDNGQQKDIKNPDKSKRNDLLIGKVIIKDLEFDEKNKDWINGSLYGPEKGMFIDLKITELRENEIVVVGSKMIFRRTLVWKKMTQSKKSG